MRTVLEHVLPAGTLSPEISMNAGSQILRLEGRSLFVLADTERAPEMRKFALVETGLTVPQACGYIGTVFSFPRDATSVDQVTAWHLFELFEALPDDLPAEMHGHYRELLDAGFTPEWREGVPRHSWKAPADIEPGHLTTEQIIAVASLEEHGYGPVV